MLGSRRGLVAFAYLFAVSCDSSVNPSDVDKVGTGVRVAVTAKSVWLVVGQERQLVIAGSGPDVTWRSDNAAAVSVSSTGLVSARSPGIAHIVVREQSAADTTTVTVRAPIDHIQITADSLTVAAGRSAQLSFRALDESGATIDSAAFSVSQTRWNSTMTSIATVDSVGLVSASTLGRTEIVLTIEGKTDTAIVDVVPVAVATIELSAPPQFGISAGSSYQITPVAKDAAGNALPNRTFLWSSSDATVATVSQTGVVSGVSPGSAQISASSEGRTAVVGAIVLPQQVATVTVSLTPSSLAVGQTAQAVATLRDLSGNTLSGRQVAWTSSSPGVASVSASGVVSAAAAGTSTLTAASEGKSAAVSVSVTAATAPRSSIVTIGVSLVSANLSVGQTTQATATALDAVGNVLGGQSFTWTSSNSGVATVSSSGTVTAVGSGSATITAAAQGIAGSTSMSVSTPAAAPALGGLPSHDFEDGTLGPYWNPYGAGMDIVDDPTNSGHGKVARLEYAADGVTRFDDNRAFFPKTEMSIGLGDSIWFRGDFYLPATVNDDPSTGAMRKLLYWGWTKDQWHFPHEFDMIITLQGSQVEVTNNALGPSNLPVDYTYLPTYVTKGRWHTIETQLKVNSSFAAQDGTLRIWLDGALIYDRTNMRWTDPLWTDDPATYKWTGWGVGDQMQARVPYDEYRYWDNVTYAKTRVQH
jgi:uncharacterized protein YjdB